MNKQEWTPGVSGVEYEGRRFDFTQRPGIVWCQSCLAQIPQGTVPTHICRSWWDGEARTQEEAFTALADQVAQEGLPLPTDYKSVAMYHSIWYQVNEQFVSVQGEGYWQGTPSTFIRLQGCSVGCPWCDSGPLADLLEKRTTNGETKNTWGKGGRRKTLAEIVADIRTRHVVVTGGEPTIWNLDAIIQACWDIGCVVQLETSGQNELKGELAPDWITWSPKERLGYGAPASLLAKVAEVKWVVDPALSFDTVWAWREYFAKQPDGLCLEPIFTLMPEGCPPKPENIERCLDWLRIIPLKYQSGWRFGDRLQYRLGVR